MSASVKSTSAKKPTRLKILMKAACIVLSIIIVIAMVAVICMVKFATEISVEERRREDDHGSLGKVREYTKLFGVISLNEHHPVRAAERFPYVAAVMKIDANTWSFSCFGSIILANWLITGAHCRKYGVTHRVLLYSDFEKNYTHTYPILIWRVHEKYNANNTTPMYDIAVAKLHIGTHTFSARPSVFDDREAWGVEASIWKTVTTMDNKMYLTNDFEGLEMTISDKKFCYENYAVDLNESLICVDMRRYADCFVTEFGPLYSVDRVVGILAVKPRDCDTKFSIFTNVSFYYDWIISTTHVSGN